MTLSQWTRIGTCGLALVLAAALLTGCASQRRLATIDERTGIQTALQQYIQESRLIGQVRLRDEIHIQNSHANVGYELFDPSIHLKPQRLHAKMLKTQTGWQVLSNDADPTLHDLSAWPVVRPDGD